MIPPARLLSIVVEIASIGIPKKQGPRERRMELLCTEGRWWEHGGWSKHVTAGRSCSQSGDCSVVPSLRVYTELGPPLFHHPYL